MAQKNILIVSGEASGDANAAGLARKILELAPQNKIFAVGGPLLRQAGAQIIYDIKELSVMGLFDVLKKLPKFFQLQALVLAKIKSEQIDAIILVDFSGFNLRLAKKINNSLPVFYYTSPQVWASRPGRVQTIKKFVKKMLVFFLFEVDFYKKFGVDVEFVGHPLLDTPLPAINRDSDHFSDENKLTIALLPGSRQNEIKLILPVMLASARIIQEKIPNAGFLIAKAPNVEPVIYENIIRGFNLKLEVCEGKIYDCLNQADFALVCSGTATLETAIMQKPFLIVYKMNPLNYLLYRPQVKLPYIGMVNIIAGKKVIPEFIQGKATAENISKAALEIINNPQELSRLKNELAQIKTALGTSGASAAAARIILDNLI